MTTQEPKKKLAPEKSSWRWMRKKGNANGASTAGENRFTLMEKSVN